MAKKLYYSILLCFLSLAFNPSFARNGVVPTEPETSTSDICDAPPPDSFRVASRGPDFITVAWNPIAAGITHTLSVFTKSSLDEWVSFGTYSNVAGGSFTVNGIAFEADCKLVIATNCAGGGPSIIQKVITPKIVLELDVSGHPPFDPLIADCTNLDLTAPWVGFRVERPGGGQEESNLFELNATFDGGTEYIKIRRVYEDPFVKAANSENEIPPPSLDSKNPFQIMRIENGPENIGWVKVIVDFENRKAYLCPFDSISDWNTLYEFTALTATTYDEVTFPDEEVPKDYSEINIGGNNEGKIKALSPFHETLTLFMGNSIQIEGSSIIRLLNTRGQTVFEQKIKTPFEQVSLSTEALPLGIYLLHIYSKNEIHTVKVIKTY